MKGIKNLIIGLIIGLVVGLWCGINIGKDRPLWRYPLDKDSVEQKLKETGGQVLEKGGKVLEKSGKALQGKE